MTAMLLVTAWCKSWLRNNPSLVTSVPPVVTYRPGLVGELAELVLQADIGQLVRYEFGGAALYECRPR